MVFYESCFLNMWVDSEIHLMYSEWLRLPTRQEYQEGVKKSEELLSQYQVYYWIMDSTNLANMPIEEQKDTLLYMAQVMASSTLRKIARIIPKDNHVISFFEETIHAAKARANSSLEIDRFQTYKAAADWIGKVGC